jgi:hypothetical protein
MKKSIKMPVWLGKIVLAHTTQFAVAGKRPSNVVQLKNECNNYDQTAAECF